MRDYRTYADRERRSSWSMGCPFCGNRISMPPCVCRACRREVLPGVDCDVERLSRFHAAPVGVLDRVRGASWSTIISLTIFFVCLIGVPIIKLFFMQPPPKPAEDTLANTRHVKIQLEPSAALQLRQESEK